MNKIFTFLFFFVSYSSLLNSASFCSQDNIHRVQNIIIKNHLPKQAVSALLNVEVDKQEVIASVVSKILSISVKAKSLDLDVYEIYSIPQEHAGQLITEYRYLEKDALMNVDKLLYFFPTIFVQLEIPGISGGNIVFNLVSLFCMKQKQIQESIINILEKLPNSPRGSKKGEALDMSDKISMIIRNIICSSKESINFMDLYTMQHPELKINEFLSLIEYFSPFENIDDLEFIIDEDVLKLPIDHILKLLSKLSSGAPFNEIKIFIDKSLQGNQRNKDLFRKESKLINAVPFY